VRARFKFNFKKGPDEFLDIIYWDMYTLKLDYSLVEYEGQLFEMAMYDSPFPPHDDYEVICYFVEVTNPSYYPPVLRKLYRRTASIVKSECECGKEKHGFASHSDWCKLYKPKD